MQELAVCSLQPVGSEKVRLEGGFLGRRVQVNEASTLPAVLEQCERSGRLDALHQRWRPGDPNKPHPFWDSDVAKWLEAASYSLAARPDAGLSAQVEEVVTRLVRAQQPDGYLNSYYTTVEPAERWSDVHRKHELYCAGHLMEAAVAHHEATGDRRLLEAACRYADHIASVFGPNPGQKRGYPGHQEIELALVKLYRVSGERRYLDLAKFFIDERGRQPHYFDVEAADRGDEPPRSAEDYDYMQAHRPVREQADLEGHSVRGLYMLAGMIDVAVETEDAELLGVCRRLWASVTRKRMYITGGVGSTYRGERFTFDYDLPNEEAYAETCAAIGLVFVAHRLLQIEPDGGYADVMERVLYNGLPCGVSLTGDRFFYSNPLTMHPRAERFSHSHYRAQRQPFFDCACCPPNIARLLADLGRYVYSTSEQAVYAHLYAAGRSELELSGRRVKIIQETDYPWQETVRLTVEPESAGRFILALRLPGWCSGASVRVNGEAVDLAGCVSRGYAHLDRVWQAGDQVQLRLPMPAEHIEAHPRCRHAAGQVSLQRGPVVYCLEEVDNGPHLGELMLSTGARVEARFEPGLLGGVTVLRTQGWRRLEAGWGEALYRPHGSTQKEPVTVTAVPYAVWGNRGAGEMRVWIPVV